MKIKAYWQISYSDGVETFDLEEMNCQTEKEWNELSDSDKESRIQEAIDDRIDSPSMSLYRYDTD